MQQDGQSLVYIFLEILRISAFWDRGCLNKLLRIHRRRISVGLCLNFNFLCSGWDRFAMCKVTHYSLFCSDF